MLSSEIENICKITLTDNVEIDQIFGNIKRQPAHSEKYSKE